MTGCFAGICLVGRSEGKTVRRTYREALSGMWRSAYDLSPSSTPAGNHTPRWCRVVNSGRSHRCTAWLQSCNTSCYRLQLKERERERGGVSVLKVRDVNLFAFVFFFYTDDHFDWPGLLYNHRQNILLCHCRTLICCDVNISWKFMSMLLCLCPGSTTARVHYLVRKNIGFKICLQFAVSVICRYVTVNYRNC